MGQNICFQWKSQDFVEKPKLFQFLPKGHSTEHSHQPRAPAAAHKGTSWQLARNCMAETRLGLQGQGQEGEEQQSQLQITHLCRAQGTRCILKGRAGAGATAQQAASAYSTANSVLEGSALHSP